jgi:predicted ATPase/DNA-binding CsgD family transcriptional regulator
VEVGEARAPSRRGSAVGWLTPLIGRQAELADIVRLLERSRLVTLTGAGGVGKTRLALELIADPALADSRECVFVDLAPLDPSDGEHARVEPVVSALWRALDANRVQLPWPSLEGLCDHFSARHSLLVLDNCEHLSVVPQVTELLLRRCPTLRVLATSRLPLELTGEAIYHVPPLTLPPAETPDPYAAVLASEAGRLFLERAQRSLPAFVLAPDAALLVAEICRRLDGLALAIELAAARVRVLSPRQILDGLSDRFALLATGPASTLARHRSLQASLDWSYQLLHEDARALLRRLAAASDWPVGAISEGSASGEAVLDLLGDLLDAGLLASHEHGDVRRYRLLESVRDFALERLRAAGEENQARRAHLAYFRAVAADADRLLESDEGRRSLEVETQNLRDALAFATGEEPEVALELAADLRHWLLLSNNPVEALALCAAVLEAAPTTDPIRRAKVLVTAANLAIFGEDYARARGYSQEALTLAAASGDPGAQGLGMMLAASAQRSIDPRTSADLGGRAVELLRRSGDRHDLAFAVIQTAMTAALMDRFDSVRTACQECVSLTRGLPPSWLTVLIEVALAWAELGQGDPRSGLAHAERALEFEGRRRSLGHYLALAHKIHALTLLGDAVRGRELARTALEEAQRSGLGVAVSGLEHALALAELGLGELECARALAFKRFGDPHFAAAANAHELLARVELAERRAGPLGRHAAALRAAGQHTGNDRLLAIASWADGAAALLRGQPEEARGPLHHALTLQINHHLRTDAIDTLEAVAELQLLSGRAEPAARLLGASERARTELELARVPPREEHLAELHVRGVAMLGADRFASALQEGRRLTLDDALAYARRGHGRRVTAGDGWASLTPTELKVVQAAGEGLTNAAIAARLFMSHGTVKAHLAHAYQKLDVATRLELVTLAREHNSVSSN